jgi:hypothetical protein
MAVGSVLISKLGEVRATQVKMDDIPTLHKRCGFRKRDGFSVHHAWKHGGSRYELRGKKDGKAGSENKYELPPPIDKVLFFGSMIVVKLDTEGVLEDLTVGEWEKTRVSLFGGLESLDKTAEADEDEEDEAALYKPDELTSTGYLKDGWIVDDGAGSGLEEEEYEDERSRK